MQTGVTHMYVQVSLILAIQLNLHKAATIEVLAQVVANNEGWLINGDLSQNSTT